VPTCYAAVQLAISQHLLIESPLLQCLGTRCAPTCLGWVVNIDAIYAVFSTVLWPPVTLTFDLQSRKYGTPVTLALEARTGQTDGRTDRRTSKTRNAAYPLISRRGARKGLHLIKQLPQSKVSVTYLHKSSRKLTFV